MQFHQAHLSPVPPDRMVVMLQGHPSHLTSPPHQMYSPSSLKPLTSLPSHLVYLVPCGQMPRLPPCPKLPCQDQVHSRCSVQVQGCREGSLTLLHKDAPLGEVNSSSSARRASLVWWVEGWISVCVRASASGLKAPAAEDLLKERAIPEEPCSLHTLTWGLLPGDEAVP